MSQGVREKKKKKTCLKIYIYSRKLKNKIPNVTININYDVTRKYDLELQSDLSYMNQTKIFK